MIRCEVETPIGALTLVSNGAALTGIYFPQHKPGGPPSDAREGRDAVTDTARDQLCEYFAGARNTFDIPLDPKGTPFQQSVWEVLKSIPRGETRRYAEVAEAIGAPRAVRAVGAAIGRNPISIIVPCHRVVGAGGRLTGFAGGLPRKEYLLRHEGWLGLSRPQGLRTA